MNVDELTGDDPSSESGAYDRDDDYITTRITADGRDGFQVEAR